MFDTNKVAKKIKQARNAKDMTQMDLADAMGVSYQAVSNWERGNSMLDISKLPQLCNILEVSFEELVGEESKTTQTAKKLMEDENVTITLEEIADIAPIVKPQKMEKVVKENISSNEKMDMTLLIQLVPFLDKDTLDELAKKAVVDNPQKLTGLAPFLGKDTLDMLVSTYDGELGKELVGLAPFLSKDILSKYVERYLSQESCDTKMLVGLAPFLSKEAIGKIVNHLKEKGKLKGIVPFAPFIDKSILAGLACGDFSIFKKSDVKDDPSDEDELFSRLDRENIARLANEACEAGQSVEQYLDYMDTDAVGELAGRAFEKGMSVEPYLDYMDEADMKEMIIRIMKDKKC